MHAMHAIPAQVQPLFNSSKDHLAHIICSVGLVSGNQLALHAPLMTCFVVFQIMVIMCSF